MDGNAVDGILMRGVMLQQLVHSNIPNLDGVVRGACGHTQTVRMEGYVVDRAAKRRIGICAKDRAATRTSSRQPHQTRQARKAVPKHLTGLELKNSRCSWTKMNTQMQTMKCPVNASHVSRTQCDHRMCECTSAGLCPTGEQSCHRRLRQPGHLRD